MLIKTIRTIIINSIRRGNCEIFTGTCGRLVVETNVSILENGDISPPFDNIFFDDISDLKPEEIDSLERYHYRILNAIEFLRMASNGSLGGLEFETVEAIYNLLCGRLDDWRPSSDPYDDSVKKMLELTLESYRNSFWRDNYGI